MTYETLVANVSTRCLKTQTPESSTYWFIATVFAEEMKNAPIQELAAMRVIGIPKLDREEIERWLNEQSEKLGKNADAEICKSIIRYFNSWE